MTKLERAYEVFKKLQTNRDEVSRLEEEITVCEEKRKKLLADQKTYNEALEKKNRLSGLSKKGNVLLIIAALLIVGEVVLLTMTRFNKFSSYDLLIIGGCLVPGIILKISGMKESKEIKAFLNSVNMEQLEVKKAESDKEIAELDCEIDRIEGAMDQQIEIMREQAFYEPYDGEMWMLTKADLTTAETFKKIDADFCDLVCSPVPKTMEGVENSWISLHMMQYLTAVNSDDKITRVGLEAMFDILRGRDEWHLQLLGTVIPYGIVCLSACINGEEMDSTLDDFMKEFGIAQPTSEMDMYLKDIADIHVSALALAIAKETRNG